jgi:glycosyltransferase involved in cell wall biosynthesis
MKQESGKIDVVFLGRYNDSEILSGPEKTAVRIFYEHTKYNKSVFIQYFFDGRKYGFLKKLFGKEKKKRVNNSDVLTLGLLKTFTALIRLKPEIIHIITFERFAVTAFLYRFFCKTNIIYCAHGIVTYENTELKKVPALHRLKDRFCERIFLKYSDKIIFYSENSLDIAEKYFKIDEYKSVILSGGIDEVFSRSFKNKIKTNGNIKAVIHQLNVFSKSSAVFLNNCLDKISCSLDLFVIGNYSRLLTENPKIKIQYLDKMSPPELAEFYKDIDVFLSLNSYETFSISTAEAMAAGLVPVVTEETGISRYIINGENGFTVKYGDTEKLAELINYLSSDRTLINEISASSACVYEMLSWSNVYETYSNIYRTMLK